MSFIVQISPFVHLFTLEIVFRWGANLNPPHQGFAHFLCGKQFLALGKKHTVSQKLNDQSLGSFILMQSNTKNVSKFSIIYSCYCYCTIAIILKYWTLQTCRGIAACRYKMKCRHNLWRGVWGPAKAPSKSRAKPWWGINEILWTY
jgi:hypothetical protein